MRYRDKQQTWAAEVLTKVQRAQIAKRSREQFFTLPSKDPETQADEAIYCEGYHPQRGFR